MPYEFKQLSTESDYAKYSKELQEFESQFEYPLGADRFKIIHGRQSKDYFSFFKKLGRVYYFVVENNTQVVGVGCAVLRTNKSQASTQKYWYLCDFKIAKGHRGKGLLKGLVLRYFLRHYFKSNKMIALNMSPPQENSLANKVKGLFSWFDVKTQAYYIAEISHRQLLALNSLEWFTERFLGVTNDGDKDIMLKSGAMSLVHFVEKDYAKLNLPNHVHFSIHQLTRAPEKSYMLGTTSSEYIEMLNSYLELKHIPPMNVTTSCLISHKFNVPSLGFSTAEI